MLADAGVGGAVRRLGSIGHRDIIEPQLQSAFARELLDLEEVARA